MSIPTDHYDDDSTVTNSDTDEVQGGTQTLGDERSHEQMHRECEQRGLSATNQEE